MMSIYGLGPKAQRVCDALRQRILAGIYQAGTRLPSYPLLAQEFGVATLTMRQVLAALEEEGLLIRQRGLGTFVCAAAAPLVLLVDDDPSVRLLLRTQAEYAGCRVVEADGPDAALAILERERDVALVVSDVRMPKASDGIELIRRLRTSRPELPLIAVTGFADDLAPLHGTAECPVLVLSKPVRATQFAEALAMALARTGRRHPAAPAALRC